MPTSKSTRHFNRLACLTLLASIIASPVYSQNVLPPTPGASGFDVAATNKISLLKFRRLFRQGSTPSLQQLEGKWRGANKGIVELAGYNKFIKDIYPGGPTGYVGDNIQVSQYRPGQLQLDAWYPKYDPTTGDYERRGKFQVQPPSGVGYFGHGVVLSYRDGGNPRRDPARFLEDKVVRLNERQMLGRATANFGPIKIPLSYFILERIE